MIKYYTRSEIMEKISDKVKSVDDLLNLPLYDFDRECCDLWYNDYLNDDEAKQRGYISNSNDLEFFYAAFYLIECVERCDYLVLIEHDEVLYFIFDPIGLSHLSNTLTYRRESMLRKVADITNLLSLLDDYDIIEQGYFPCIENGFPEDSYEG